MYEVTRQIDFCYGHRLINYDGKCRHLHGHNGRILVTFAGESLNELGMVLDFSEIKAFLSTWIDENLDHRMLLHKEDPAAPALKEMGEPLFLMDSNPTAENIAKLIFDVAKEHKFPITKAVLWETPKCFASYSG